MSNFSLDYCIDEFMIYCRSRDLRRRTLDSYEHTLRLFEQWCEVKLKIDRIRDVNEQVIRRYITNLQERGKYTFYADEKSKGINFPERRRDYRQPVTTATINNYIRNLKVFFNWLDSDDIRACQKPVLPRKNPEVISPQDFYRGREDYIIYEPPSQLMTAPLQKSSSARKNLTAAAISSGSPHLPSVFALTTFSLWTSFASSTVLTP